MVQQPSNGEAGITGEGLVNYTPRADFYGQDSFTYKVADGAGHFSQETKVDVHVINENDSPVINSLTANDAIVGTPVTIVAEVSDADNDELIYQWEQTAGPVVQYQQIDNKITFTALSVLRDTLVAFNLVVSDSDQDSSVKRVTLMVTNEEQGSGGSFYYLFYCFVIQ